MQAGRIAPPGDGAESLHVGGKDAVTQKHKVWSKAQHEQTNGRVGGLLNGMRRDRRDEQGDSGRS